jgi:hypothetical protein
MFERFGESVGVGEMEWEIRSGERYSWISKGDTEAPRRGGYTGRGAVQGGEVGDAPREEGGYKRETGAYTIPAV